MWGAATLHADTYEEVEADRTSIGQAWLIVLAACTAIGVARAVQGAQAGETQSALVMQVTISVLEPLVLWIGGSAVAFMVGASFFRGPGTESDFAEVLRPTGFAFTPALLRVFAWVPPAALGLSIDFAARAWVFVAVVIALRQALDFTTLRAVGTFGTAAVLLNLIVWGLVSAPVPF
jgi:hypothetical protein